MEDDASVAFLSLLSLTMMLQSLLWNTQYYRYNEMYNYVFYANRWYVMDGGWEGVGGAEVDGGARGGEWDGWMDGWMGECAAHFSSRKL